VGYVDLSSPSYELEYRMSLAGIIFLIPFTIFGVLVFMASFYFYKKAIDSFIERKANELILNSSTFKPSNLETL
jgi:nitrogen fixation/metabolism regulation signal transduction histidine kinase